MSTAFTVEGTLNLPGAPELSAEALPFGISASYDSKAEYEFNFTGAATQTVNFGTVPATGAKALLVVYETKAAAPPVNLTINGGDQPIELATGGFLMLGSPVPVDGVVSLAIAATAACRVRVWLLG